MIRSLEIWLILLLAVTTLSCNKGFNSAEEFYKWLNNPDNGLVVTKQSADKELLLKYLPVSLLVYNEIKDQANSNKLLNDSLSKIYSGSRSFLLTIKYKNDDQYDPLYEGISSYQEFSQRKQDMNFGFDQFVEMHTKEGNIYHPVLSHMEDTYGLQKYRNIYLVFAPDNKKQTDILESDELDIMFDDRIFNTGIHHFIFRKENMDKTIELNFLK